MKVVIHAGLPKTGTTSFQAAIFANRDLLQGCGVFFPSYTETTPGHRRLSIFWDSIPAADANLPEARSLETWRQGITDALKNELEAARQSSGTLLLSFETASNAPATRGMIALRELLLSFSTDIEVLAYVRHPLRLVPSAVQQELKSYDINLDLTVPERARSHIVRIARLREVFGRDAVRIRLFERSLLREGDIVLDLCSWMAERGVSMPPLKSIDTQNEAICGAACSLLYRLRAVYHNRRYSRAAFAAVRRFIVNADARVGTGAPLVLPERWTQWIQGLVASDWNLLLLGMDIEEHHKAEFHIDTGNASGDHQFDKDGWLRSYTDVQYDRRIRQAIAESSLPGAERMVEAIRSCSSV